jgi:hypothetical protein
MAMVMGSGWWMGWMEQKKRASESDGRREWRRKA